MRLAHAVCVFNAFLVSVLLEYNVLFFVRYPQPPEPVSLPRWSGTMMFPPRVAWHNMMCVDVTLNTNRTSEWLDQVTVVK